MTVATAKPGMDGILIRILGIDHPGPHLTKGTTNGKTYAKPMVTPATTYATNPWHELATKQRWRKVDRVEEDAGKTGKG